MLDPEDDPEDDHRLKQLLASNKRTEREKGLENLNNRLQEQIFGHIQKWSNIRKWRFSPEDIAIVWQHTIFAITKSVDERTFKPDGSLNAYVKSIAWNKAIDFIRDRSKRDASHEISQLEARSTEPPKEVLERLEHIQSLYNKLAIEYRIIVKADVDWFSVTGKFPSLAKLTKYVNQTHGLELTEAAVKSRQYRAWGKLRGGP